MSRQARVKICGITTPKGVQSAVSSGASYIGFVFFEKSPRHLRIDNAASLALIPPAGVAKVALTVNATNAQLDEILRSVPLDMLQLHGAETVERVLEIKSRYGLPVMKAIGVRERADLEQIELYSAHVDQLLIDAKPPCGAELPGGNGLAFDWRLLDKRRWLRPWMLAGGLTPENVGAAVSLTHAKQVDVSSGVESAPGQKDPDLIEAFCQAAL